MNLSKVEGRLLAHGKKSEHRVLVQYRDGRRKRCPYRPGQQYAITVAGKTSDMVVLVSEVRLEKAGDIDFEAARREGYRTPALYKAEWVDKHDRRWSKDWYERNGAWTELQKRFDSRWADREVWAIVFESVLSSPRLLHADSSRGYTSNPRQAMKGEPEAVGDEWLAAFSRRAAETAARRRAERLERLEALTQLPIETRVYRLLEVLKNQPRRDPSMATRLTELARSYFQARSKAAKIDPTQEPGASHSLGQGAARGDFEEVQTRKRLVRLVERYEALLDE